MPPVVAAATLVETVRQVARPLAGGPGDYDPIVEPGREIRFVLLDCEDDQARAVLGDPRLERAIGVIYRPETERQSHYFRARLAEQFDVMLHFDETSAVEPFERTATFPFGV